MESPEHTFALSFTFIDATTESVVVTVLSQLYSENRLSIYTPEVLR